MKSDTVYSYHTFLFPFVFDMGKRRKNFNQIKKFLEDDWKTVVYDKRYIEEKSEEELELAYNEYQYFLNAPRKAIYRLEGDEKNKDIIVKSYINKRVQKYSKYIIKKGEEEFVLNISSIFLNIYNTGVGILGFKLENTEFSQSTMQSILRINEYGRRIFPPYIGGKQCGLVGDSISITALGQNMIHPQKEDKIVADYKKYLQMDNRDYLSDTTYVSDIIQEVLGKKFSFGKNSNKGTLQCKLVIDDRMFVLSGISNKEFLKNIASQNTNNEYAWEENSRMEYEKHKTDYLYEYVFIDGNEISCIDSEQRYKLLKEHLNTRWLGLEDDKTKEKLGTVYGITQHSMVVATNADFIMKHFLTMYTQMAILTLVQRTSIISLSNMAAELAASINGTKNLKREERNKIIDLQRAYAAFENQILFFEVTAQEQGIELYEMLQKFLLIERENNRLQTQIQHLYEVASMHYSRSINRVMIILGIITFIATIVGLDCTKSLFKIIKSLFKF